MADTKITALAAITTVDPAADVLPIVDVSDTSMAASGTTKKITSNQILGAGGTATLASATITGAATVTGAANLNGAVNLSTAGTATVTLGSSASYGVLVGSGTNAASIYINGATRPGFNSVLQFGAAEHQWYNSSLSTLVATLNTTALTLSNGNLVIGTSGKGIDFSATTSGSGTMTSELLNDYEEGTFTPIVGGTATYTGQVGRYTKIGNRVFFNIRLIVLLVGTGSASTISGLPFAAGASTNFGAISVGYFANLALNQIFVSGITNAGSSSIIMNATASSTANMTLSAAIIGNTTDLAITGFYEV